MVAIVIVVFIVRPVVVQIIVRIISDQRLIDDGFIVIVCLIRIIQIRPLGVHCIERNHVSWFEIVI